MALVHLIDPKARRVLRNVTFLPALFFSVTACSDRTQEAMEAGAIAQQQMERGELVSAKRSISDALAARDDIVALHLIRGQIELQRGSDEGAYDAYNNALSLDPANGEALLGVSQLGLRTGHLRDSLEATNRILLMAPQQPNALLIRGIHDLVRRRFDEAIAYADRILLLQPGDVSASILKARALFMKGDPTSALSAVDSASNTDTKDPSVPLTKLEIFRELRRPDEMGRQFELLRTLLPEDLGLRLDEANLRFKTGQRAVAQELVIGVLSSPNASQEVTGQTLGLWAEYGTQDMTERQFDLLIKSPSSAAREAIARFLIEQRQFDRAKAIVASLDGNGQRGLSARLLANQGKPAQALKIANAVLEKDKTQCDALTAKSEASSQLGKRSVALEIGQRAAAECPNQVAAWLAAAQAYRALKIPSGVERVYSQALDSNPQNLELVRSYAGWLFENGRKREALAIARRLTREAPALVGGWRYYAAVCQRAGDDCEKQANQGLANARTRFGIDLEPGTRPPNGLFGRFVSR
ncbi:MAG: tetratricopeptide repeat protein [Novosphingobium sp.]|nr:tetratricopeptide repeat protein [Novosphingobium sp.]